MNNNRSYNKNHKRNAYESMRALDARVASLYSKAICMKNPRSAATQLYEGYMALLQAIRICHRCELLFTNMRDVEIFLTKMGFLGQQKPRGEHQQRF